MLSDPAELVEITMSPGPHFAGSNIDLDCLVTGGNPTPTLKWFRESTEVGSSVRYSFTATADDNNKIYRCDATNSEGTVSNSITFELLCQSLGPIVDTS